MPTPYNYSSSLSPIDPAQEVISGLASGYNMRKARQNEQINLAAAEKEKAFNVGFENAINSRDPKDIINLFGANPEKGEILRAATKDLSAEQRRVAIEDGYQLYALALSGSDESVQNYYQKLIDANTASGNKNGVETATNTLALFNEDPDLWAATVASGLEANDPENFGANVEKFMQSRRDQELQPGAIRKQKAELDKLNDEIKWKNFEGLQKLSESGVDITAMVAEDSEMFGALNQIVKKQKQKDLSIVANNKRVADKLDLDIENLQANLSENAQKKINDVDSALSSSDDLINFIDEILLAGGDYKDTGSPIHEVFGSISGALPTLQQDNVNFEAMIDTIKSKIYLDKVSLMRGTGPLSDREGAKLEKALRSLNLRLSPEKAYNNLKIIQKLSIANRALITKKWGDMEQLRVDAAGDGGVVVVDY